jgi:hypothetical protein
MQSFCDQAKPPACLRESPTLKATFTPLRVLVACEYSGIVVGECIGDYLSREDVQKSLLI